MSSKKRVVSVTQSPTNAKRWLMTLDCGHTRWVTSVRRPLAVSKPCETCPK